jgi:hypothetical protein
MEALEDIDFNEFIDDRIVPIAIKAVLGALLATNIFFIRTGHSIRELCLALAAYPLVKRFGYHAEADILFSLVSMFILIRFNGGTLHESPKSINVPLPEAAKAGWKGDVLHEPEIKVLIFLILVLV